ncbi:MAG: asparagine synthase (glutamine-hydrolyzing) [Acetobacterales bacterium]
MCGIVGLHGPQEDAWIEAMNARQVHRGPDGEGLFRDRDTGLSLAMRRLAILDAEGGAQPMSTPDGRHTIVFNGEIYNAPDLRRDLEAGGHRFRSDHSDTEVLLTLLAAEGPSALPRLDGMFAFALYDRDAGRLFCARDRLGIKPFYYAAVGGRFAFASELKSLLALPFVEPRLNPQALFHYMSLMYVPGADSIVDGVWRLPPGHHLTYRLDDGEVSVARWWRPEFGGGSAGFGLPRRVREGLADAVSRWSLSDVPIGCSLSGGLDSSSVVGLLAQAGHRVRTYSVGFTGEGEGDWNELPNARAVAEKWGTEHHEIVLQPETLLDDLPQMVWHLDEPYGGGLPSWSVFKAMGADVKVGMTGVGGDELFGNYGKWRELEGDWRERLRGPRDHSALFRREFAERYYYLPDAEKRERVFAPALSGCADTAALLQAVFDARPDLALRDRVAHTDIATQLPDEFLTMTDRFSMAHGVEARTPLLDHRFVEAMLAIPADRRTQRRDLKRLMRRAAVPLLPRHVVHAPKKGFVIPLKLWLRDRLAPLCRRLLDPDRLEAQGLFRRDFHARYVAPHVVGEADHTNRIWAALMFQLWHRVFVEGGGARPDFTLAELAE